jgi:radical SAM superfamily enzyme YgiQ (UPF0313 family)
MKIFLGNSPWNKPGLFGVRAGSRWPHFETCDTQYMPFPFYLAYATAVLEKAGHEVLLVDGIAEGISTPQFIDRIEKFNPDMVVYEVATASFVTDLETAKAVHDRVGRRPTVFCGIHEEMYHEKFFDVCDLMDYILMGEYEYNLLDLVSELEAGREPADVSGIIYRSESGKVEKTRRHAKAPDINSFPWPSRHHLPMNNYHDLCGGIPAPSVQLWGSRGCPYGCIFCAWPQIMYGSRKYRTRDPIDCIDEMEMCVKDYGMASAYFDDDTFNIGESRIVAVAEEKMNRGLDIPWSAMCRADTNTRDMLVAMRRSNLWGVKYGVESANQAIVDQSDKNLDLGLTERMVKFTQRLGIRVHLTFTFGLPGETRETMEETLRWAKYLNPDTIQFSICTPFPGSKMFDYMQKKGYLTTTDWANFDGSNQAVVRTEHLEPEDLEEMLVRSHREWEKHKLTRVLTHPANALRVMRHIKYPRHTLEQLKRAMRIIRAT